MLHLILTLWNHLNNFCQAHEAILGVLGIAFVATMPPELPQPFCRIIICNWVWTWLHDGLKTFVSFRSPGGSPKDDKKERP